MLKRTVAVAAAIIIMFGLISPVAADNGIYKEVFVSNEGNDAADGSKTAPFATIARAKEYVKSISDNMNGDIIIHLEKGKYMLDDMLVFTSEDSGKNGYRVIYRGEDMPLVSGGTAVGRFEKTQDKNIYRAPVDGVSAMREMYVNGRKAYLASSERRVKGIAYYNDPTTSYEYDGMYMSKDDIGLYRNVDEIEFSWQINWKLNTAKVESIEKDPDNDDRLIVRMKQNWWESISKSGDSSLRGKPYRGFIIKNAYELLDKPGEFYYNSKEKYVYYIPREGEDLTNAEVFAPRLDKLIKFDGNDRDDRVKNITFDGIKFAHTAFHGIEEDGVETAQQQLCSRTSDIPWYMPAAISLERTDGIEFLNNYFFGFGAAGIYVYDAADNTNITGNAFSDIGDASIAVGRAQHGGVGATYENVQVIPPIDAKECNLVDGRVKVAASYHGNFGILSGSANWYDDKADIPDGAWHSDPYGLKKGEKGWIRYDFENKYSISKVCMAFNKKHISEAGDFEILLSNDRNFAEGSYITAAAQIGAVGERQEYNIDTNGEKYRYLMIRTIDPGMLAVSKIDILTNDRKPFVTEVPTRNTTIANNYIRRSGESICSGGGISCMYTSGLEIIHNEIADVPYSGLMFGWGWNNKAYGSENNHVAYNYIHGTNNTMHDGAAIYSLSSQNGTVVEENYVRSVFIGSGAFYPDEGSARSVWKNNVSEDVVRNYNIWISTIIDNSFLSSYGWHNINRNDGTGNVLEPINEYLPGNEPGTVYAIKKNAGLEEEYKHIKALVPDTELEVEEPRVILAEQGEGVIKSIEDYVTYTANEMIKNGSFGTLYGDYPIKYKYLLKNALAELNRGTNDRLDCLLKVRRLINEAADNVIRIPLYELIDESEKNLKNTPTAENIEGACTKKAYAQFESVLNDVKKKSSVSVSAAQERDLTLKLEKAYSEFENSKIGISVKYLYLENMIDETIDNENAEIVVYMPKNIPLNACSFEFEGNGECAVAENTINLEDNHILPVYSKALGKYKYYNITVKNENENKWETVETKDNAIISAEGYTHLSKHKTAYIYSKCLGNRQTIEFIPNGNAEKNKFSIIFGANSAKSFEINSADRKSDCFIVEVNNNKADIYLKEAGVKKLIKSNVDFDVLYNENNTFSVALHKTADKTVVAIYLNGILKESLLAEKYIEGGYVGFYSEGIGIDVIDE